MTRRDDLVRLRDKMAQIARGDFSIMTAPDYVTQKLPSAQEIARACIEEIDALIAQEDAAQDRGMGE